MQDQLIKALQLEFDVVGVIQTKRYLEAAKQMNKNVPDIKYETMVVLGLAYPMRIIKHTKTHLVPSFYTFGMNYHTVLKNRIIKVMEQFNLPNQLIINKDFGTYLFLGVIFIDLNLEHELILEIDDDCGTCRKCIDACPVNALFEDGSYDMLSCMSHYNQTKRVLTDTEIDANYSLFGCDICQMVCPKNVRKGIKIHKEFELTGKEMVSIVDLFTQSEKEFKSKYDDMSYLWKGKTLLMRNALLVMQKQTNRNYIELIEKSIDENKPIWYKETANKILIRLKK